MSGYAVILEGEHLPALVVGAGAVALRKIRALVDAGAAVKVVAPDVDAGIAALEAEGRLTIEHRRFTAHDLDGARLVIAATDSADVNAHVALEAKGRGILVNVADAPELGDFVTPATHRAGDVLVAVSAGGVPAMAARIRDAVGARFDGRYAEAARVLGELRASLLASDARDRWRAASAELLDAGFCERVERGRLADEVDRWR